MDCERTFARCQLVQQRIARLGWTARRRRPGVDPSGCANGAELESALS